MLVRIESSVLPAFAFEDRLRKCVPGSSPIEPIAEIRLRIVNSFVKCFSVLEKYTWSKARDVRSEQIGESVQPAHGNLLLSQAEHARYGFRQLLPLLGF